MSKWFCWNVTRDTFIGFAAGNGIKNLFSFIVAIGILVLAGLWILVYNVYNRKKEQENMDAF